MTLTPWIIIIWNFLTATPALGVFCAVNMSDNQTTYTIKDMPDVSDVGCGYSWTNKTGHVLANQKDAIPELVIRYSSRAFTTSRCLDMVHYEGTCGPKWEMETANCTCVCVKKSGEAKARDEVKSINETAIIVTIVIIIGVVLILPALCYMFKKKKCIWKRSPMKGENAAAELRTDQQDAHELEPFPV